MSLILFITGNSNEKGSSYTKTYLIFKARDADVEQL